MLGYHVVWLFQFWFLIRQRIHLLVCYWIDKPSRVTELVIVLHARENIHNLFRYETLSSHSATLGSNRDWTVKNNGISCLTAWCHVNTFSHVNYGSIPLKHFHWVILRFFFNFRFCNHDTVQSEVKILFHQPASLNRIILKQEVWCVWKPVWIDPRDMMVHCENYDVVFDTWIFFSLPKIFIINV